MNAKKKLLFSFAGLILSIAIFSTVVFAWFAISSATSEFVVESGKLETDTHLYYGDWDGSTYTWNEVNTKAEANYIFDGFVPGQILTFKLQMSNFSESSIKTQYQVDFGMLMYLDGISDSPSTAIINEPNVAEGDRHIFNAINVKIFPYSTTIDATIPDQIDFTTEEVDGKVQAKQVEVTSSIVHDYKIAGDDYLPVTGCKILREYLSNKNLIAKSNNNLIGQGKAVVYIIKIYFNPLYITPSNDFMNKSFRVEKINVTYTQKQEITE